MEYEILVEKNINGRVIVDFYGLDFDITDEFVDGKCHKVIFGDPIVFVLKGAEAKDEPVENSNTAEEVSETHEESPAAEAEQHDSEQPVENASEENHAPDGSNNENTPAEEDVMKDPKETEHNPETQEGEN